jgi:transaldolase
MKATQLLHELGQSLWLDNITRDLLDSGTLERYIDELSVSGLTSNPTIFDHTIKNSAAYDAVASWHELMEVIGSKSADLRKAS